MKIKQIAVDKLSNTMRMYGEARFNFERIKLIDKEEAINNLDRAFESKLEAFHSLYDVTKSDFNYFEHADTALLILIRMQSIIEIMTYLLVGIRKCYLMVA